MARGPEAAGTTLFASAAWTGPRADWRPEEETEEKSRMESIRDREKEKGYERSTKCDIEERKVRKYNKRIYGKETKKKHRTMVYGIMNHKLIRSCE